MLTKAERYALVMSLHRAAGAIVLAVVAALCLTVGPAVGQVRLKYRPPILPLSISIDSNGRAALGIEGVIQTPIGAFSLTAETPVYPGTTTLTIVTKSEKVVYRLSQGPSTINLPAEAHTGTVTYDGRGNIIVRLYPAVVAPDGVRAQTPSAVQDPAGLAKSVLNIEYDLGDENYRRARFRAGSFRGSLGFEAWVEPHFTTIVDLDGDGRKDAVVLIKVTGGGSGVFRFLYPVLQKRDSVSAGQFVHLGDRTDVRGISTHGSRVLIDMVEHGPNDGMCCPTVHRLHTLEYRHGGLVDFRK